MAFDLDPVAVMKALQSEKSSSSGLLGPDPMAFKGSFPSAAKAFSKNLDPTIQSGLKGIGSGADSALFGLKEEAEANMDELRMAGDLLGNKANEEMAYRNRLASERFARRQAQGAQDAAWMQLGGTVIGTVAGVLI